MAATQVQSKNTQKKYFHCISIDRMAEQTLQIGIAAHSLNFQANSPLLLGIPFKWFVFWLPSTLKLAVWSLLPTCLPQFVHTFPPPYHPLSSLHSFSIIPTPITTRVSTGDLHRQSQPQMPFGVEPITWFAFVVRTIEVGPCQEIQ